MGILTNLMGECFHNKYIYQTIVHFKYFTILLSVIPQKCFKMYHYWLINPNENITIMQNVNNRTNHELCARGGRCLRGFAVLFTQFTCKPKPVLKE